MNIRRILKKILEINFNCQSVKKIEKKVKNDSRKKKMVVDYVEENMERSLQDIMEDTSINIE